MTEYYNYILRFRTLSEINVLPFYHGMHWYAMFRHLYDFYLQSYFPLDEYQLWTLPTDSGIYHYKPDEFIYLSLTLPKSHNDMVLTLLSDFPNYTEATEGHFQPNETIQLEGFTNRCGDLTVPLRPEELHQEIEQLLELDSFTLEFQSPFRVERPPQAKKMHNQFYDADFFWHPIDSENNDNFWFFFKKLRKQTLEPDGSKLSISGKGLYWHDMDYGKQPSKKRKQIGGTWGTLICKGRVEPNFAKALVLGQYLGIGKCPNFGFGFYQIPELEEVRRLTPLRRGKPIVARIITPESLHFQCEKFHREDETTDNLIQQIISRPETAKSLCQQILDYSFQLHAVNQFKITKLDGKFRSLMKEHPLDHIIHNCILYSLVTILDPLLEPNSYAFRPNRNRLMAAETIQSGLNSGFYYSIKLDIAQFFDSIDWDTLLNQFVALFPWEPLCKMLIQDIAHLQNPIQQGIPQGWSLSPLLSNLYLSGFDRLMKQRYPFYIRYCDDMLILMKDPIDQDTIVDEVNSILKPLKLSLNHEKTKIFAPGSPIEYLGYHITEQEVLDLSKQEETQKDSSPHWNRLFSETQVQGIPIYLSYQTQKASSKQAYLVAKQYEEEAISIPWSNIKYIHITGKANLTQEIFYRALRESIPIYFSNIMGKPQGSLIPANLLPPKLAHEQKKTLDNKELALQYAKELILAKVHNSQILLKRNKLNAAVLEEYPEKIRATESLDSLRGVEGMAAKLYFGQWKEHVTPFTFQGRIYHPPPDEINCMLSLGYTLLYNRVHYSLLINGLDSNLGVLHQPRGNHHALASDLMEPLRHIIDRMVLGMIHLKQIRNEDFSIQTLKNDKQTCSMKSEAFRKFIHRFEKNMAKASSYNQKEKMSMNAHLDQLILDYITFIRYETPFQALRIR